MSMTLTRKNYNTLLDGAKEATDLETYIAEWGTSSILCPNPDAQGPETKEVVDTLTMIWTVAHITIQDLVSAAGGKITHLAARFGIPYRTVQGWVAGERQCPGYVLRMMAEILDVATVKVEDVTAKQKAGSAIRNLDTEYMKSCEVL